MSRESWSLEELTTMLNLHKLLPCAACPQRMAVPGTLTCTTCAATDAAMVVPDTIAEVFVK